MKANSVLETIGRTPHIRFSRLFPDAEIWHPFLPARRSWDRFVAANLLQ